MQTTSGRRTLKEAAQMAILALYAGRDSATADEVAEATREFSARTAERARADLTAGGVLRHGYTGRPGKRGHHYYEIDRGKAAPLRRRSPRRYLSRTTRDDDRLRHGTRTATDGEHGYDIADEDDYGDVDDENDYDDVDDEDDYDVDDEGSDESARAPGSGWGWIVTVAALVCGLGGVVWARRRFGSFPIAAGTHRTPLPPYNPPSRPPRRFATVAPRPDDDAIFGPDPAPDETYDRNPIARSNAYDRFATFPNVYDFGPQSGA